MKYLSKNIGKDNFRNKTDLSYFQNITKQISKLTINSDVYVREKKS